MSESHRFTVSSHESKMRLDRYLVAHLPRTLSRAAIQRAIEQGAAHVGTRLAKAHRRLEAGDVVSIEVGLIDAPGEPSAWAPEPIPLNIVYEDADLLLINKPPGLVTHPAPGHWSGTLVNAVLWHLQQVESGKWKVQGEHTNTIFPPSTFHLPPALSRAGIVHRLDKDTSGLLVVAKTDLALRALSSQLKSRTLGRTYLALVEGHLPFDEGTVDAAIGRHQTRRKAMAVRYLGGREAVTRYRVLHRLERSRPEAPKRLRYTALDVALQTGRTHQIRVHLAHLGHPVLGDLTYGRHPAAFWEAWGIRRQLLHAWTLRLQHPVTRQLLKFDTQVPSDMAYLMAST